ncbi:tail fiber domain-containing protein, partial [bacterium]|nr:tail fiber domain-containing protein [bacterium]
MPNGNDFSSVSSQPYWKVAGAQAEKDPYGFSDAPYGAPTEDKSLSQYQLEEHVKSAQQMGQLQAARRGFNPLMARAATESGAELGSMAQGQSQALAMQERMNQLQGRLAQQQGLSEADMQRMGIETGKMGLGAQQAAFMRALEAQRQQEQQRQDAALTTGILGGVANLGMGIAKTAMVMSDERLKENIKPASGEADARLEALAQALRPVGSASGAKMVGQWQPDSIDP